MKKSEIFETVKNVLIDTLGIEDENEVYLESKLIEDLGAESIDFLDIMARLERRFDVSLSEDEESVEDYIMKNSSEEELETGVIPSHVLKDLPKLMPELDPDEFVEGLTFNDIPRLFTINSLVYAVTLAMKKQKNIEVENDI
ncbi:acyl carrier protein [Anaerocolumna cellulosilytica]|uniref:Acyl carrier protein n=1 Tax=Anaerocolumna cellulosilytica TaxID=433286 RepID=A0A6S6QUV7_9FIRM|nr:phosphopantetheine-binding protein [Anaerocolumna cellulosilytica]MBB5196474.1 acyl carrier protein [Anaerocolumna cellulosilytica]BCJ94404.1 acyl carrier protein [Anaerocolumna cellulosilytica]